MEILHEINATVNQIINDLKLIVKVHPECTFGYSDENESYYYLSSVCLIRKEDLLKDYDLVILKSSNEYECDPITAAGLLKKMKKLPSSAKVVLGDYYYLKNLETDDGHFLLCEDECGYFQYGGCDIRLHTLKTLQDDMLRFADRFPDRRVVVLDRRNTAIFINDLDDDDGRCYMSRSKEGNDIIVSSFLEAELYWDYSGIEVGIHDEYGDYSTHTIQVAEDGTIFFEYKVGDEDVIACRLGDKLYDDGVDLGLSVKWASCNLGATKPEEYGRYFAWGDVKGQTWDGSKWSDGGFEKYPKYKADENYNLIPKYDAAHVILGGSYRMPTYDECRELVNNCESAWTDDYNGTGVKGRMFTSKKNGNSIFLPAAGNGYCGDHHDAGSYGDYWSGTRASVYEATRLNFSPNDACVWICYRDYGLSVRPVSE